MFQTPHTLTETTNSELNMNQIKVLDLKKTILADNDADAEKLRAELDAEHTFYLNVMSSPGSGKTSTILRMLSILGQSMRVGVLEADIDGDTDARAVMDVGVDAVQLHTGGMCHLDADMSRNSLKAIGSENYDLIILENVGNLVCPAEFDTGAHKNLVILSVPEGDDKPLKYPLMFEKADAVCVNKIDAMPAFDFDMARFKQNVALRTAAPVFFISAATGEGIDALCGWLCDQMKQS